jgi:antitoxin HigA-1
MTKLKNIHSGEILREEFLNPMGIKAYKLSQAIGVPQARTSQILVGRRRIKADFASRLGKFFGTSTKFWFGLQNDFGIEKEKQSIKKELELIETMN